MLDSKFNHMGLDKYKSLIERITKFCLDYQTESENKGEGTRYRTYREIAKRYDLTYEQLYDIIQDSDGKLETISGFEVGGLGGGVFNIEKQGEYQVEYVR